MEKVSGSSPLTSTKITQSNDCVIFLSVNVLCANKFARATALNRYALTLHFASKLARSAIKRVRSKGQEPNHRLAFGGCLQTLAFFRATYFLSLRAEKRGPQKILLYFWGKGVCKHKTGDCRLRRLTGQKRSIRRVAISRKGILVACRQKRCAFGTLQLLFVAPRIISKSLFVDVNK